MERDGVRRNEVSATSKDFDGQSCYHGYSTTTPAMRTYTYTEREQYSTLCFRRDRLCSVDD